MDFTTQGDATLNPKRVSTSAAGQGDQQVVARIRRNGGEHFRRARFRRQHRQRAGTITGTATVNVTGAVIANSLPAQFYNGGGTIGGNATINMNLSGSATVTNDATVTIFGNDPAGSAAINFNGGSYDVGGTFLSQLSTADGTLTFNNASAARRCPQSRRIRR